MKRSLILALAILSPGLAAGPAHAQDLATSIVRTADLDLTSDSGRRSLELRIRQAARDVCGAASDVDLEGTNAIRHCRDQVIAEAALKRDRILAAKSGGNIVIVAAR